VLLPEGQPLAVYAYCRTTYTLRVWIVKGPPPGGLFLPKTEPWRIDRVSTICAPTFFSNGWMRVGVQSLLIFVCDGGGADAGMVQESSDTNVVQDFLADLGRGDQTR
jgi:hypothetical protein